MRTLVQAAAFAVIGLAMPMAAQAACSTASSGARCVAVPAGIAHAGEAASLSSSSAATPAVAVGDTVQRGRYSLLLNADYYGLPPVADGWVYLRVGHDVFRVDWASQQVLERVTERASANF